MDLMNFKKSNKRKDIMKILNKFEILESQIPWNTQLTKTGTHPHTNRKSA